MLAHIHIMKTAGQTVCDILRESLGPNHCDLRAGDLASAADVKFATRFYPNLQCIAGHAIRPRGDLLKVPQIRFFTFLRDPIARCVSHYQFERNRNGGQVEFLPWLEQNANYQTRILSGTRDPEKAIKTLEQHVGFVGLVEDFVGSLELLKNWSGFDLNTAYRSRNVAQNKKIKQELMSDAALVHAMHDKNASDLVLYRHVVDSVYPELVERYSTSHTPLLHAQPTSYLKIWSAAKRNCIYKPLAKTRQRLRSAA